MATTKDTTTFQRSTWLSVMDSTPAQSLSRQIAMLVKTLGDIRAGIEEAEAENGKRFKTFEEAHESLDMACWAEATGRPDVLDRRRVSVALCAIREHTRVMAQEAGLGL